MNLKKEGFRVLLCFFIILSFANFSFVSAYVDVEAINISLDDPAYAGGPLKNINEKLWDSNIGISATIRNNGNESVYNLEYEIEIPEINYKSKLRIPPMKQFWLNIISLFKGDSKKDMEQSLESGNFFELGPGEEINLEVVSNDGEDKIFRKTGGNFLSHANFDEPGEHTLIIKLDPKERIEDTNRENNVLEKKFIVEEFPSDPSLYTEENIRVQNEKALQIVNYSIEGEYNFSEAVSECRTLNLKESSNMCLTIIVFIFTEKGELEEGLHDDVCAELRKDPQSVRTMKEDGTCGYDDNKIVPEEY